MVLTTALACARSPEASTPFRGVAVMPAIAKVDFALTDTDGRPFQFVERTHGKLALVFFGYTHCPDVCPVQMTNLAAVLQKLSPDERAQTQVVFITTDPARDSLPHLREWLDNFDPTFIGLSGSLEEIHHAEDVLKVGGSSPEFPQGADSTNYGVFHAAQVLAFTPDDSLRAMYPFGIRQQDWAEDIPKLLKYKRRK